MSERSGVVIFFGWCLLAAGLLVIGVGALFGLCVASLEGMNPKGGGASPGAWLDFAILPMLFGLVLAGGGVAMVGLHKNLRRASAWLIVVVGVYLVVSSTISLCLILSRGPPLDPSFGPEPWVAALPSGVWLLGGAALIFGGRSVLRAIRARADKETQA